MFAACPHCHFLIALHPQQRAVPATCPRCGKRVDDGDAAPAEALEEMPAAPAAASPAATEDAESDAAPHKPDLGGAAEIRETGQEESQQTNPETARPDDTATRASIEAAAAVVPSHAKTAIPSFSRTARTSAVQARVPRWQWLALTVLSLLLAIQMLLADRARLAGDAGWRPLIATLCGVFRCSVPVWRQPEAFTMLSRDVRPVGDSPGTLQAQATFRNDARWAQAWPIVLLTLKDADGRTLGARALTPAEYLDASLVQTEIAPGQSAQMAVRIREPSANVVAFSFDFR